VHGSIFGFFLVGGPVYVDKKAPPAIRAQAQGLIVLICFGVGMLIGTFFNVELIERYTTDEVCNWNPVFMITALISAVLLVALAALFRDDVAKAKTEATAEPESEAPQPAAS
jgi:MFS family permease